MCAHGCHSCIFIFVRVNTAWLSLHTVDMVEIWSRVISLFSSNSFSKFCIDNNSCIVVLNEIYSASIVLVKLCIWPPCYISSTVNIMSISPLCVCWIDPEGWYPIKIPKKSATYSSTDLVMYLLIVVLHLQWPCWFQHKTDTPKQHR